MPFSSEATFSNYPVHTCGYVDIDKTYLWGQNLSDHLLPKSERSSY